MRSINKLFHLALAVIVTAYITACQASTGTPQEQETSIRLSADTIEASGAYLTTDNRQQPVLCWTEKHGNTGGYVMKFAVFESLQQKFGEPVTITSSLGARAHDESMNKIAYKEDGTIIAMFGVKHPTKENRFAGSILYSFSSDGGKTWTDPGYLHDDTAKTYGRSFFDMVTLPDGEVGAIWLDGRFGDKSTGSAIFFDKTVKGGGFGEDRQVGESTCECCRTDIYLDLAGNIHIAYRDILFPPALMGKQVRDMVHSISYDGGESFSEAKRISEDNWAIEGCPHTGPSLASNQDGLHAVWFTAGGDKGVYYTSSFDDGKTFSAREMISKTARHPQMITLPTGALVMVWDEFQSHAGEHQHMLSHGSMQHVEKTSGSRIVMQIREPDGNIKTIDIASDTIEASHPVITALKNNKLIIAWTQKDEQNAGIYYKTVDLNEHIQDQAGKLEEYSQH